METEKGYRFEDLQRRPTGRNVSEQNVTFVLYTRNNPTEGEYFSATDFTSLVTSNFFDPIRKNLFTIHGYQGDLSSSVNQATAASILPKEDVNIFAVDWSGPAGEFYTEAVTFVPTIGRIVGDFINFIVEHYEVSPNKFGIVGHSLGAQVSGVAGASVNGLIEFIVGMDPAGPLFSLEQTDNRLDPTDAAYVQVIHTNVGLLGFQWSMGHSDYFPNGGESQPGCGVDITGYCSHARSHQYYAESLATGRFVALKCGSYEDFNSGLCDGNEKSYLGEYILDYG